LSALEAEISRLGRLAKGEQLYRQGQELIKAEDMTRSCTLGLSLLKESAGLGHADSAFACGCYLMKGLICEGNADEAKRYFELSGSLGHSVGLLGFVLEGWSRPEPEAAPRLAKASADRGNAAGQALYGLVLTGGGAVPKDEREALRYLKLSADQGNPTGQMFSLAALMGGLGTEKNEAAAVEYARKLAGKGDATDQGVYAFCLLAGEGVERKEAEAVKYAKLSADQNNVLGLTLYGTCLSEGTGIAQDPIVGQACLAKVRSLFGGLVLRSMFSASP
jgi:TPR repeat protein